ncbi:hypothetical protein AAF712_000304 [Marasmius tenuissimus]|uniref:Uncharacterized protein n=1 Tax=Marasmius tenuissimus TaxID=585030 RepID=A0ABR3AGL9_9AGAR|nr:hypothetical protein PM082_001093 [Marasmius tenuissimus]
MLNASMFIHPVQSIGSSVLSLTDDKSAAIRPDHVKSPPFSVRTSDDKHRIEQEPHTLSAYGLLHESGLKVPIKRPRKARRSSNASTTSTTSTAPAKPLYLVPWAVRVRQLYPDSKYLHDLTPL